MKNPILISGIQPSGRLHIGNYLGAIKNFVELQNSGKYDCYFFVADLHSLTEKYDISKKPQEVFNLVVDYLAAGLSSEGGSASGGDSKKSTIFIQSQIKGHTELAWILSTLTPMGELNRMTQFKEKSQKENENVGLFTYPVLMAADILLYNVAFVPVGDDQLQHLEFARVIARKFNKRFGDVFIEPRPLLTKTPRIMSLSDPNKKMSKSELDGCLFIDDEPEIIKNKISRAVTDSGKEIKYDEKNKPGISNLLLIASGLSGKSIEDLEKEYSKLTYSQFKEKTADLVSNSLKGYRENKKEILKNTKIVEEVIKNGKLKAEKYAIKKLEEIKKSVGLI